jgi:hypothetical protein
MQRLAFALLTGTLLASLSACTVCHEEIIDQSTSPDRQWTTRTTLRGCGRQVTTNVYLQRADSRVRLGEIVVLVRHTHPLQITWKGPGQLQIACAGCGEDVRVARPEAHGIHIAVRR